MNIDLITTSVNGSSIWVGKYNSRATYNRIGSRTQDILRISHIDHMETQFLFERFPLLVRETLSSAFNRFQFSRDQLFRANYLSVQLVQSRAKPPDFIWGKISAFCKWPDKGIGVRERGYT